jgi:class 3 adenylate cyclase
MTCQACAARQPPNMRYCGMCGEPLRQSAERERRRVSVMFIDLAGFTTLTHQLDPEAMRDLAEDVLDHVARVIEDHDGTVESLQGDGLIAMFGAPYAHPDDPFRAVLAAIGGLRAIEYVGEQRGMTLQGRAGIATGVVIAGEVGSGRIREYTVMGSVVNLASRLEGAATPGEVWIDDETYRNVHARVAAERVDQPELAGFPDIGFVHRIMAKGDLQRPAPPFVGRAQELATLHSWLTDVAQRRRPRLGWVLGGEGSGKSLLMQRFAAEVGATVLGWPQVIWLAGPLCGEPSPYHLLAAQLFGLRRDEDSHAARQRISEGIARLLPASVTRRSLILASLDLDVAPSPNWPTSNLEGPGTYGHRRDVPGDDATVRAWRDLLEVAAEAVAAAASLAVDAAEASAEPALQPVAALSVLVDLDRHDPDIDLLERLVVGGSAPLLWIRSSRSSRPPARRNMQADRSTVAHAHVLLGPLSAEEANELLHQLAAPGLASIGVGLLQQIGRNPATVVELALSLDAANVSDFQGSLTSMLQARLDALPGAARKLLPLLAVSGERCWEGLLRSVYGDVREALGDLLAQELVLRSPQSTIPGEAELRFRSPLLRRAALDMTPHEQRRRLHLRIAGWLEQHAPLTLSANIARHFSEAEAAEAAFAHFLAAAAEAEVRGDEPRADRMLSSIEALELPAELYAQAALTGVSFAIDRPDLALAEAELARAEALLQRAEPRRSQPLQRRAETLKRALHALKAASTEGVE